MSKRAGAWRVWSRGSVALLLALSLGVAGCGGSGSEGASGGGTEPPTVTPQTPPGAPAFGLDGYDPLPGIVFGLVGTFGGSGPEGSFQPGDSVTIQFTLKSDAGVTLDLTTMDSGSAYLSGPTFNYNLVIPRQDDLRATSIYLGNATWQYTFPVPLPAVYAAPYNDTASFGPADGELTGQPLLAGTYSIGLETSKVYTIEGEDFRDPGALVAHVRLLSATTLDDREVVTPEHCNQCHSDLRFHGNRRVGVELCVLCHTAGAEDRNNPAVAGGTPGVSIDFKVMIHKIHMGKHLPSVLGMSTDASGNRVYGAGTPYKLVGFSTTDASAFGFPVMPSAYVAYLFDQAGVYTGTGGNGPMPRDAGYTALTPANRLKEDTMRSGVVSCASCHGDPDGAGPVQAPAQGGLHEAQPGRAACGSCHDDVDWAKPYAANGDSMIANPPVCTTCHPAATTGVGLYPVRQAHLHPYVNPALNTGVNVAVTAVGGGTGVLGRHQVSDPILATISVTNDAGTNLQLNALQRFQAIVTGPTQNPQMLGANVTMFDSGFRKSTPFTGAGTISGLAVADGATDQVLAVVLTSSTTFDVVGSVDGLLLAGQSLPLGGSTAVSVAGVSFTVNDPASGSDYAAGDRFYLEVVPRAGSYARNIPTDVALELVGAATGGADVLYVANLPLYWGRQVVLERTALVGGSTPLASDAASLDRHVVVDASAVALAVGDRVVLDAGSAVEEYLQVGRVQTTSDANGADLGVADRVWFTTALRFAHAAATTLQEVTLTSRREGLTYAVTNATTGEITLVAGQFGAGNPVVVSYRTHLRFGRKRGPGDPFQAYAPEPVADAPELDASWGDWKGLPFLDGTYTVGFWVNRDFSVALNVPPQPVETTSYRMISPPASGLLSFGATSPATPVARPELVESASCNRCHGDLTFHGNGRRGLGTCLMCHTVSGMEDGPKYSFSAWPQAHPTPGVSMDFRQLLHKIHMGKELSQPYEAVGVFLGVPYPATVADIGFPAWPGEAGQCRACHGEGSTTWHAPSARAHPGASEAVRVWRGTCSACHDSTPAVAHMDAQTGVGGVETCTLCHGAGKDWDVAKVHPPR